MVSTLEAKVLGGTLAMPGRSRIGIISISQKLCKIS
jgi:hypothetical protein